MEQTNELNGNDRELLGQAAQGYETLCGEIARRIIGQEDIIRQLLAAVFSQGHVLIIGVPGLAKTLLVKTLSDVLGWSFKRIQFTPDMMPADIIGMELLQENDEGHREWKFTKGPIFANMILADEINRTPPKTQSALLEAMQEYHVTSMGHTHAIEQPFIVVATQNPIEQEGTYPLPEAQLDRFMLSLWVDYPTTEEEQAIVAATTGPQTYEIPEVFSKAQMMEFQQLVRRIPVSQHVINYAVELTRASRPAAEQAGDYTKQYVEWGAGPRGAQNLILAGKALAVVDGKPTVSCEHIREAAYPVLRHRVLPNYNAAAEGINADAIIRNIIETVAESTYAI